MKKIFIYYSLTGNGDTVASYLKDNGWEIRKVETCEPLPRNYILSILAGGYKAMVNYEDKLIGFDANIEEYDEVAIGSPIWNERLSSPINTVLKELDLKEKKLFFVVYSGSGKSPKATQKINNEYPQAKVIDLVEPKKNKDELLKLNI